MDIKHLIITLPAVIKFEDYQSELNAVEDGKTIINFKVPFLPKNVDINKTRVYLCHRNFIIGYMTLTGLSEKEFTCQTTNRKWKGFFLERSGKFYTLKEPVPYRGFQGFRYIDPEKIDFKKLEL